MQVVEMQDRDRPVWDEYVRHSAHALPLHLSGWREVMQRTYGYPTHFLMAMGGGQVEGVLPLIQVRSWLVGKSLSSLPGGLCAENEEAAQALIHYAEDLTRTQKVARLILRDSRQDWAGNLSATRHHSAWVVTMADTVDATWNAINRKTRREIRLAQSAGVQAKVSLDQDSLEQFYRTFSSFVHQAGTPVFSRKFLRTVTDVFPEDYSICNVYKDSTIIGSFFQLELNQTIYGMWGAALPQYRDLNPTHMAYWEVMRAGLESGFRRYDMGRSPLNSGPSDFKKHWGGQEQPVYQHSFSANGQPVEAGDATERLESDPKFKTFINVWRKLPLSIAQFVGPQLRWHVPFA